MKSDVERNKGYAEKHDERRKGENAGIAKALVQSQNHIKRSQRWMVTRAGCGNIPEASHGAVGQTVFTHPVS